ncbi:hypothetical protein [Chitinophaga vietnamensis]|uniref:hypothetical protein n=1 Tax=Chitinophaga vietnamensis TaxID=2593957 RepID=UPI00117871AF|nr:hypothetical protein [Chitinophaga vietnamensis]
MSHDINSQEVTQILASTPRWLPRTNTLLFFVLLLVLYILLRTIPYPQAVKTALTVHNTNDSTVVQMYLPAIQARQLYTGQLMTVTLNTTDVPLKANIFYADTTAEMNGRVLVKALLTGHVSTLNDGVGGTGLISVGGKKLWHKLLEF